MRRGLVRCALARADDVELASGRAMARPWLSVLHDGAAEVNGRSGLAGAYPVLRSSKSLRVAIATWSFPPAAPGSFD